MKSYNPFCLCSRPNEVQNSDEEFFIHEQQLNRNLADYGIQRIQVKGDGNCLFYALSEGLIYEMKMDPDNFNLQLQTFGLSTNFRLIDFANFIVNLLIHIIFHFLKKLKNFLKPVFQILH
jgi:hypothetical protein